MKLKELIDRLQILVDENNLDINEVDVLSGDFDFCVSEVKCDLDLDTGLHVIFIS